eukprot:scaffold22217_cov156-Isochrysis_galbana.AAC.1
MEFHLSPSHPRVQGYACTKIYRAAGESRVNAARLALEDLARFEGSDPQLSLFRRRLDASPPRRIICAVPPSRP